MKSILYFFVFIFLSTIVYSQQLTNNQVIQMVKDFENNQNLTNLGVRLVNLAQYNETYYDISLNDLYNSKTWFVINNEVCVYINHKEIYVGNKLKEYDYSEENINYTKDQCKIIALNYLNSKNVSLIGYNAEPKISWENDGCYEFFYYQIINIDLQLKSKTYLFVNVNAFTGNVASFNIHTGPMFNILNIPTLTIPQVVQIVEQNFNNIQSSEINVSEYYINQTNDSIYRDAYVGNLGIAEIDAYTHEIVKFRPYLGGKTNITPKDIFEIKPAKKSNDIKILTKEEIENMDVDNSSINFILFNTESTKDVKYTDISKSFDIDKEDKGIARMEVNGNKFIFRNGSYWCFINNKTYNMGGNCIIENGKLKLPEEFYKKVQDKDYQFFKK